VTSLVEGEAIPAGTRYLVVDTEGRPAVEDMADLTRSADAVLVPTAPNSVEVEATARLLGQLRATDVCTRIGTARASTTSRRLRVLPG